MEDLKEDELLKEVTEELDKELFNDESEEDNIDLDDLLEEEEIDDTEDNDPVDLSEYFNKSADDYQMDSFKIEDYLRDNFSFKEIDNMPFEEYMDKQLENPHVKEIMVLYEKGFKLKGLDTFEDFIKYKKNNGHIYMITLGFPFEYEMFGIEPRLYVCKAFTGKEYYQMIKENPDAEKDLDYFNNYILSSCMLFPELRLEDVERLETGVIDILLPAILKHSRFNSNYRITRM